MPWSMPEPKSSSCMGIFFFAGVYFGIRSPTQTRRTMARRDTSIPPKGFTRWLRRLMVLPVLCVAALLMLWLCDRYVALSTGDLVYGDLSRLPSRDTALVLGTARHDVVRGMNPFYTARLAATARLFHGGKVRAVIVSGDNRTKAYNEPKMMRRDLIAHGVPAEFVTMDFAGFRTLDSVVRAREVFGQKSFVIVSQRFQLERALYIARAHGIDAIGFVADSPPDFDWTWKVRMREVLARSKAVLDVKVLNTMPRFLGPLVEVRTRE